MRLNINDLSQLPALRDALARRNVAVGAVRTLENALRNGMMFRRADDLELLDIPAAELGALREAVVFGPRNIAQPNIKTVEYRLNPVGAQAGLHGYQLLVRTVTGGGFSAEESYPVGDQNTVMVDYDLAVLRPGSPIVLRAKTAAGTYAKIGLQGSASGGLGDHVEFPFEGLANAALDVGVEAMAAVSNPSIVTLYPVRGKLISRKADSRLDGYQVVLFAATSAVNDVLEYTPVATAVTETNGYFVTSPLLFPQSEDVLRVKAAKALVSKEDFSTELPIRLLVTSTDSARTSRIPERVILIIDEGAAATTPKGDAECGCNDLNFHEKKVLEEFSYYTVVRTSEPSIIADVLEDEPEVNLQDIYGVPGFVPLSVFRKYHDIQSRHPLARTPRLEAASGDAAALPAGTIARTVTGAISLTGPSTLNQELLDRLLIDHKAGIVIKGNAKPRFRGRSQLTPTNQIDWDDTPTIYQAASIAHGHLLHFKQEWMPDGYSIGDLVYSLPLAPGQKKQIAVLDWERRESAANVQALDYEETLSNSLVRDRDISEVVSGTLTENIRGNSKATTRGIGFGFGGSVMGIIPGVGTFGSLLGISGGASSAGSTASQSGHREMTSSSLQSISDRTQQAASVVRSQRATVVQTVSQGERVQATAESVANYNHCHAITIQYFEVLRHFAVRNRLAGVQECLFIPLQMSPFDAQKCLRWRNSLEKHLFRPELRGAFDAIARIQNERESAVENYYDSIGFPRRNHAEQAIRAYSGELLLDFFFFNTSQQKIDEAIVAFYSLFGISLDALRDRAITDDELAQHVGPRAIEYLLDAFVIETDKGTDLKLDFTLVTTFRQGAPLRVSLRQSAATPRTIPRERIEAISVRLDLKRLSPEAASSLVQFQNKYMKVRLRSGQLRYRTDNLAETLFDGRIDNDVYAGGDGAYIPTPLTATELRNPRGEDLEAANNLIHHLNENLEYYNRCLFFDFTPERRFMLLDGIVAPGKANGRSVASVVENRVIGIAGNSLIMPVAPGYQLDPTIDETFDMFAQYYDDPPDPLRISMPTKGVYAEAVMGKCNSCEEKDETRFWRWEESPVPDSPSTQILPLNADTRRADPGNLQAKDFPNPVVNIQNAPSVPDPTGLQNLMQALAKGDAFRDLTGLNQNQLNALAVYQKALDSAGTFGKEAAELAKTMAKVQLAMEAQKAGALPNRDAQEIVKNEMKQPDPEKERQQTAEDLDTIEQAKQKGQVDDSQGKEMSEDVVRKRQGTTRPPAARSARKGKRKIRLSLSFDDHDKAPLEGTWVLNYGSIIEETFESKGAENTFDVELDTSRPTPLMLRGNPYVTNVSFPPDNEYYYHRIRVFPKLGAGSSLTLRFAQEPVVVTVTHAKTDTDSQIKSKAVAQESGTESEIGGETGALEQLVLGKIAGKATMFGKETTTTTGEESDETSESDTTETPVRLPGRMLVYSRIEDGE